VSGVLVAGVGNLFLRDDGFGPEVVRRLAASGVPDGARVVDYGIRGTHLAYDLLDGWGALVLVDALPVATAAGSAGAGAASAAAGEVVVLEVGPDDVGAIPGRGPSGGALDPHGMDPLAVLAGLAALGGRLPRTLVVGCCADDVGEGIGLSPAVAGAVPAAVAAVRDLLDRLLAPGACRPAGTLSTDPLSADFRSTDTGARPCA
jgi:hydrogenase maturation protease